ncbi:MAG TPA: hypothetical protein VF303_02645 [Candidatus Nanoarchaeia archaeon]
MRGIKIIVPLIAAFVLAIAFGAFQVSSTEAHNSHVEYVVPEQPGISVDQRGNAGLVIVEVTECLTAGEEFAFTMLVSSERGGSSTLSVRKNRNVDISSWFSLDPEIIDLPSEGTEVTVKIKPPMGTELDRRAVTRIQEVGDGPVPGGHHGVKVRVSCVKQPVPTSTPSPTPPPGATPTPTPVIGPPAVATPVPSLTPTPTPEMPKALPESGGEPPSEASDVFGQDWLWVAFGTILVLFGIADTMRFKVRPRPFRRR